MEFISSPMDPILPEEGQCYYYLFDRKTPSIIGGYSNFPTHWTSLSIRLHFDHLKLTMYFWILSAFNVNWLGQHVFELANRWFYRNLSLTFFPKNHEEADGAYARYDPNASWYDCLGLMRDEASYSDWFLFLKLTLPIRSINLLFHYCTKRKGGDFRLWLRSQNLLAFYLSKKKSAIHYLGGATIKNSTYWLPSFSFCPDGIIP